uniref:phospholipase D-like domain-containing protein n=1 Tax=Desertibaculum subflavum TaxID=2268458 RepID=UPI0034D18131
MQVLLVLLAALAGFVAASLFAVYAYGRFAKRAQGIPSQAFPVADDAETALDHLIAPLTTAHREESGLALLADNVDAFAVRALTARRAGRSLDLQSYMWRNDLTGRLMVNEIVQAADRGVRVRLLLDDLNARGHDRFLLALDRHPNIEIRLFNPGVVREGPIKRAIELMLRAFAINRRMHNKAWIADGRVAIVGGRNVGDAYFDADQAANFRDLDVLMLGPVVQQTETVFDRFWNSRAAIPIRKLWRVRVARLPRTRRRLAAAIARAGAAARPYLQRAAEGRTL